MILFQIGVLANKLAARIITHAPLRAKEASPFVNNKYAVVVCYTLYPSRRHSWRYRRITNTMLSSLERAVPGYVQPLVSLKPDSTQHVYQNYSLREVILLLLKVVSMQRWVICTKTIGDGTCMILWKAQIGWEIKMLFTTWQERHPRALSS